MDYPEEPIQILHVDDDEEFADLSKEMLEREHDTFDVVAEDSADAALDRLSEEEFDCIISDYDMPGQNGVELLRSVRTTHPDLPFILFTGKGSEEVASEAISAGVTDYVQKQLGREQYELLANRIVNTVTQFRAERDVERTRLRFQTLVEEATDGILIVGPDGTISYATPSAQRILGRSPDELRGTNGFDPIHPADQEQVMEKFARLLEEPDERQVTEFRYEQPDGSTIWAEARGRNLLDDPIINGLVVYVRNVTDRKERELELQRIERRYQAIFNDPNILVGLLDTDGTVLEINDTAMGYIEATHEAVTGTNFSETPWFEHSSALQTDIEEWIEQAASGMYVEFEAQIGKPGGDRSWIEGVFRPVTNDEGNVVSIIVSDRDITERKRRKRELERFKAYLEETSDIIAVFDDSGIIQYESPAVSRILGYDQAELVGEDVFDFIHPADVDSVSETFSELVAEPGSVATAEYRFRTAQDEWCWLEARGTNQLEHDAIGGIVTSNRDITERKQYERELEETTTVLSTLFDTLPVGVLAEGPSRNVFTVNDRLFEMFGMAGKPEEAVGADCRELAESVSDLFSDSTQFLDRIDAVVDERTPVDDETLELRDGRQFSRSYRPIELPEGGGNLWVYRDVTEWKTREDRLKALHSAAQEMLRAETNEEVAEIVIEALEDILNMPASGVWLSGEDQTHLEPIAWSSGATDLVGELPTFTSGDSLAWETFETGEINQYEDVSSVSGRFNPDTPIRNELLLPLGDHGIVTVGSTETDVFDETDRSLAETVTNHAEIALDWIEREASLHRREAILEQSSDVTAVLNGRGIIDYISPSIKEVLAYKPNELLGVNGFDLVHPDEREELWTAFEYVIAEPNTQTRTEARIRTANDEWRWLEIFGRNRLDDPDIEGVVVNMRDITDRKAHETRLEEMQQRTQELMHTKTKEGTAEIAVTTATETLDVEIAGFHLQENTDQLSPIAFTDTVGVFESPPTYHRSESGQTPGEFIWDVFESGETIYFEDTETHDHLAGQTPIRSGILYPLQGHGVFIVSATDPAAFDQTDRALLEILVTSLVEALERADREQTLRDRSERLERQNERLEEFASVVSHDLRNPLNVAASRVELAQMDCESEHLDHASQALDRIEMLIDDLLTLAREGEEIGDLEPENLKHVIEACWQSIETGEATLRTDIDRAIKADGSRLRQLLENLIGNAIDHGGKQVTVTVGELDDGFYVEDDGPGIPEEERNDVFDAGYSTSEGGLGFGLSIVKQVADAHSWDIQVTEGSDGGARFEITGVEFVE